MKIYDSSNTANTFDIEQLNSYNSLQDGDFMFASQGQFVLDITRYDDEDKAVPTVFLVETMKQKSETPLEMFNSSHALQDNSGLIMSEVYEKEHTLAFDSSAEAYEYASKWFIEKSFILTM